MDVLKVSFNLMVHYAPSAQSTGTDPLAQSLRAPDILGDRWERRLQRYSSYVSTFGQVMTSCFSITGSLVDPLLHLLLHLPLTAPAPLQSPLTYVLHNLINVPSNGPHEAKWTSELAPISQGMNIVHPLHPHPHPRLSTKHTTESPLIVLWKLCDKVFAYYIPFGPDDPEVRSKCRAEGVVLDEIAVPLPIILGRLAKANAKAREWMFKTLLPPTLYVLHF